MEVRDATLDDAETIARLHVQAWAEAYADILPPSEHQRRNLLYRFRLWSRILSDPDAQVALAPRVGFAQMGPQRDTALKAVGYPAELYCLYVLRRGHGLGVAQGLLRHALARAWQPFTALVLDNNPRACAFYEKIGGQLHAVRDETIGATPIRERVYVWNTPPRFGD